MITTLVREERGSAAVELVVFAIPLFVPLILLASHLTSVSASKVEMAHIARTSLRAFATAESTVLGHARIRQVISGTSDIGSDFASDVGSSGSPRREDGIVAGGLRSQVRYSYLIECEKFPCIQPLNRLRLTLRDQAIGTEIVVTTSTDVWIEAEKGYQPRDRNLLFGYRDGMDLEEDLSPIFDAKDLVDEFRDLIGDR